MPHRLYHIMDSVITAGTSVVMTASTALLAAMVPPEQSQQVMEIVLPMLGAIFPVMGVILLNPQQEHRRIVIGRAAFAFFVAALCPSIAIAMLPSEWEVWSGIARMPAALALSGGVLSVASYIGSKPFCRRFYDRADVIAAAQVRRLEQRLGVSQPTDDPKQP